METVKELSADLKSATDGSPMTARLFALRASLVRTEEDLEQQTARTLKAVKEIADKESEIEKLRVENERANNEFEESKRGFERELQELSASKSYLKNQVEARNEESAELKRSLERTQEQHEKVRENLQRQLDELHASVRDIVAGRDAMTRNYTTAQQKLVLLQQTSKQETQMYKEQLESEKKRRDELESVSKAQSHVRSLWKEQDVASEADRSNELNLARTAKERLESEVQTLREQLNRAEKVITEHQWQSEDFEYLKSELKALRKEKAELQDCRELLKAMRDEKQQLTEIIEKLAPSGTIVDGMQVLQAIAGNPDSQKTSSKPPAADLEHEMEQVQLQCSKLRTELDSSAAQEQSLRSVLSRLERRTKVLEKERTALRSIIEAYEEDLPASEVTDKRSDRINSLEDALADSTDMVKSLQHELQEKDEIIRALTVETATSNAKLQSKGAESGTLEVLRRKLLEAIEAKEKLEVQKREFCAAEDEIRGLKKTVANLTEQLGGAREGATEHEGTKILHLKKGLFPSPPSEDVGSAEVGRKRSRTEGGSHSGEDDVDALRSRIQELEQAASSNSEEGRNTAEIELENPLRLRKRIAKACADAEKRALRTREVARMKIEEFRLACYHLFGFKMQVNGAKYTLSSMYADREEDVLCFGRNESGGMQLLETAYCARLQEEIEQFLRKWNSIPALLAHITTENFQKTTTFLS